MKIRTWAMLEMARGHSDGWSALRTNTRTRTSAERGGRPGGGIEEARSQTVAVIEPQGGDVYNALCWRCLKTQQTGRLTRPAYLDKLDCVRGIVKCVYAQVRVAILR